MLQNWRPRQLTGPAILMLQGEPEEASFCLRGGCPHPDEAPRSCTDRAGLHAGADLTALVRPISTSRLVVRSYLRSEQRDKEESEASTSAAWSYIRYIGLLVRQRGEMRVGSYAYDGRDSSQSLVPVMSMLEAEGAEDHAQLVPIPRELFGLTTGNTRLLSGA